MRFFLSLIIGCIVTFIILVVGLYVYILFTPPQPSLLPAKVLGLSKPQVIGFQPYWLVGTGQDSYVDDVSTLTYFGLSLQKDGTIRKEDNPGETEPGWLKLGSDEYAASLSAHKKKGTKLSLLVSNMVEDDIMRLIEKPEEHAVALISEVAPIMRKHGFTDLNLDIESFAKASDSARQSYVQFVKTVKEEMTRLKLGTVTVELTPKSAVELHLIDVARIAEIVDYVVLMAYDYHYAYSLVAGPVAPVAGVPTVREFDVETAISETLRYADASKVILGIPFYGYEWETLRSVPGSAIIPGSWQVATGRRIAELMESCTDCMKGFDTVSQEPYVIFSGETPRHYHQIFYEDKQGVEAKIALAKKYKLAGVAVWALGYEGEGMLAPLSMYKKSVQYRGFGIKPTTDYTLIQPASLTLNPPTHALVGSISTMSGEVKKMGRQDEEYQVLEQTGPVVQGESFATGSDGNIVIEIPNAFIFDAGPVSELNFSELLPPHIFIGQKSGTVLYRVINKEIPLSIRVLRTLVVLEEGEMEISVDGSLATVEMKKGNALLGNISLDNTTTTYDVPEGQTAQIDGMTQTIEIK